MESTENSANTAPLDIRVGVVGAGKMGGALVRGWINSGVLRPEAIQIFNRTPESTSALARDTGAAAAPNIEAVLSSDVLILGVKPYQIADVLRSVARKLPPDCLVISLAAGVSCETLSACISRAQPVVRVMPNTPALVGAGATAFCRGANASDDHAALVSRLFEAVGVVIEVPETQINAVVGVAGSGVAYFYLLIEALIDGGVRVGLPRNAARLLATQTVLGAARMVQETGEHPAVLKDAVTTPGGTTIAALDILETEGIRGILIAAVRAAHDRAKAME